MMKLLRPQLQHKNEILGRELSNYFMGKEAELRRSRQTTGTTGRGKTERQGVAPTFYAELSTQS